jgi:carboxynorspermidine decarboxylase
MQADTFKKFDPSTVPSPCFVVDEIAIERNLKILSYVQTHSGAKILAALKAFSCWSLAPLISQYLSGTCASGYHEARLGKEEFGGAVHVFSAAFSQSEFDNIAPIADHLVLNSFSQWEKYRSQALANNIQCGLRINPQHSEGTTEMYDPCAAGSRLGIPISEFAGKDLDGISGLHFHTLCEQGLEPLRRTLAAVEEKFADILPQMQWVNFGGGHHISHPNYDVEGLICLIQDFAAKYQVQVYLEPGEAIAIRSGVLVSEVLDVNHTDRPQVILDTSATCHMPDTLEMPYRADILGSGISNEKAHNYRLGGMTCLAGDVIGDYSFEQPLQVGDRLLFDDMAHYTMVKTTTFNGVPLPAIAIWNSDTQQLRIVREFGYDDFKGRLS